MADTWKRVKDWFWPNQDQDGDSDLTQEEAKHLVENAPKLAEDASDEQKGTYIQGLIDSAEADERHLTLYLTFGLGLLTFFLGQLPFERLLALKVGLRITVCVSLTLILAGAALIFFYIRSIHIARMKIVRCLPTLHFIRAREVWAGREGLPRKARWRFAWGVRLLVLGAFVLSVPLGVLIIAAPTPT